MLKLATNEKKRTMKSAKLSQTSEATVRRPHPRMTSIERCLSQDWERTEMKSKQIMSKLEDTMV